MYCRIFWTIAFALSFLLSVVLIFQTFVKWQLNPVLIGFEKSASKISDVPFPAITICTQHKISGQKAMKPEDSEDWNSYFYGISVEALMQVCPIIKNAHPWFDPSYTESANNSKNYTNGVFYWYMDYSSHISANWNNQQFKIYSQTLTDEGLCFNFNMLNPYEIVNDNLEMQWYQRSRSGRRDSHLSRSWTVGFGYDNDARFRVYPLRMLKTGTNTGFQIKFGIQTQENGILCEEGTHEFKVVVHHPADWPLVSRKSFKVPFNTRATLNIKPKITKTDDALKFYKPST